MARYDFFMIFTALILNIGMTGCTTPPEIDKNGKKFNIDISIPVINAPASKIPVLVKISNKQGNIINDLDHLKSRTSK